MKVTILNNQSLYDLAIQYTGYATNALKIALHNSITPTDELIAGDTLIIPDDLEVDDAIVSFYRNNNYIPGSTLTETQLQEVEGCEGIGCWTIGKDFIVS